MWAVGDDMVVRAAEKVVKAAAVVREATGAVMGAA